MQQVETIMKNKQDDGAGGGAGDKCEPGGQGKPL